MEQQPLTHPLDISCIGIDINQEALAIYKQLISKKLVCVVSDFKINVEFTLYPTQKVFKKLSYRLLDI